MVTGVLERQCQWCSNITLTYYWYCNATGTCTNSALHTPVSAILLARCLSQLYNQVQLVGQFLFFLDHAGNRVNAHAM
jgi:hypothetical protein